MCTEFFTIIFNSGNAVFDDADDYEEHEVFSSEQNMSSVLLCILQGMKDLAKFHCHSKADCSQMLPSLLENETYDFQNLFPIKFEADFEVVENHGLRKTEISDLN